MATVVVRLLGQNGTLWIGNASHLDSSCHKWWNLCRTNWMLFFEHISLRSFSSSLYKLNESDYYNPRISFHVIICSTRNYYAFSSPSLLSPTLAYLLSSILLLHKHNSHFYDYYLHKNHSHNIIYDLDATRKSFIIILHCWRQRALCTNEFVSYVRHTHKMTIKVNWNRWN